jgi:Asp-tRNA(Asn)/Glu-tRNA(Gln) amidotransferase A subunit family amidase
MPPVDEAMEATFRRAVARLKQHFTINVVEMPDAFGGLAAAVKIISTYEGAHTHEARWREHGDAIGKRLSPLVQQGLRIAVEEYRAALATVANIKREMSDLLRQFPVLITPCAPGAAPKGLEFTGDPIMNLPWTALGTPAISIPLPVLGMPLGLQMVSESGTDAGLLALAAEAENLLR